MAQFNLIKIRSGTASSLLICRAPR